MTTFCFGVYIVDQSKSELTTWLRKVFISGMLHVPFQEHATRQKKEERADPDTKGSHLPGRACLIQPYKNKEK
jgi:hypothetical protein